MNKVTLYLGALVLISLGALSGDESFIAVGNGLLLIGLALKG